MNAAPRSVQAAAFKLVLDRAVGQYKLHNNVAIVCAGNLSTDNGIVEELSTPMQSRLGHLNLVPDLDCWLRWAIDNGISYQITSFLQFAPNNFYTFKPDHSDVTYGCPRTWDFTNRILKVTQDTKELLPMLAGTVGEGVAREFVTFMQISNELPKIVDIVNNPESIAVPSEPSILYALTGSIAECMDTSNVSKLFKFIVRMPLEFQIVCIRQAIRKDKTLRNNPSIQNWVMENSNELF
jgi:hypothetical protein